MDVPITANIDQGLMGKSCSLKTASWLRCLLYLHRLSAEFGGPVLILFFLSPSMEWPSMAAYSGWQFLYVFSGMLLIGLSLFIRIWAKGFRREGLFVWEGPFLYVRNPVQLGAALGYLGFCLILKFPFWYTLLLLGLSMAYMSLVSLASDWEWRAKVGPSFIKYAYRTRRWIPSFEPGANSENPQFSWSRGITNEVWSFLWLALLILVLLMKKTVNF